MVGYFQYVKIKMGRISFLCLLLGIYVDYASSIGTNFTLVASSNVVDAGTSVTLTCTAVGNNELTWHGPEGQITIFMNSCFRLIETEPADITRFVITCGSGSQQSSTISNLTITSFDPGRDKGMWRCFDGGPFTVGVTSAYTSLTSPETGIQNIQITSWPGFITATNQLTLLEEESETLACTAECTGTCQYTWMKGGELVASTSQLPLNNINSTMSGLYICHASYNGTELTKNLQVIVFSRDFIKFDPPGDSITLFEGQTISINCSTEKHYMCNQFGYMCQNFWDALTYVEIINPSNTNIFVINNATVSQAGIYRCIYTEDEETFNTHWITYRTLPIQVLVPYGPSTVEITPSSDPVTITSGESLSFNCSADCQPGCNYTWKYNNVIVSNIATYIISTISNSQNGTYTCTATNIVGSMTQSTNVEVNYAPSSVVITPSSDPVTITNGESLSLVCSADCQPDCFYKWTNNNVTVSTMAVYTSNNISTSQSGIYTCTVFNILGTESKSTNVVVNAPSVQLPNMTLVASETTVTTGSSVTLTCSAFAQDELSWLGPSRVITNFMNGNGCFRLSETDAPDISHISITCGSGSGALSDWTISILTINNFDPGRDTGYWGCSDFTKSIGDSVYLNSTDAGIKNIKITSSTGFISATNDLTLLSEESDVLTCTAECTDICQYKWMKGTDLVASTSQLSLNNINATLGGLYTCIATSNGSELKRSLGIYVQDRSSITINPPSDIITVNEGDSITITCSADSYPCNNINGITCTNMWDTLSGSFYNTGQGNSMVINMATRTMTGRYRCIHVEYEPTSNTHFETYKSIQLQVQYGPSSVEIAPSSDPVTITNGESLSLVCFSDCQPDCNYTWTYNNVIVSTIATFNIVSITNSQNGVYTCTATNVIGSAIKSTNVAVNYGPSSVIITPTKDPVIVQYGENVNLVCSSDCKPVCNFRWEYNNVVVSTSATYTTTITLNGTYSCTASNAIGSVTDSSNVVVKSYIKTVVVLSDGTPSTMEPGTSITMTCEADCMPVNSCSYVWKDNQNNILSVGRETTLTNVATSDVGTYTCMASNDMLKSASIEVAIKHAPDVASMVIHRTPNLSSYDKGSSLTLSCSVNCVPDCIVQWSKGTTVFSTSNGVLSLSALETDDAGTYTCSAGNSMGGPIKKTTEFTVKVTIFGTGSGSTPVFSWMITVGCLLYTLRIY
ncbi:hemicentin-1 isoform X1 [Patella vulgata]|uniref:hemicentin-1 isoform X1 n=1 Tax=Patella vulgata TaxID=6465 RepID=UPI00217FBB67|nr:hemicentin-1 isoform X1 [Patella vulgata]